MGKKYAALGEFLGSTIEDEVTLSFGQIEQIVQAALPGSASAHEAWWSNSPVAGRHNNAWLSRGWETTELNCKARTVRFRRVSVSASTLPRRGSSPVSSVVPVLPDPLGAAARYEIVLKFEWRALGSVDLDAGGRLRFPHCEDGPGLYRIRMTGSVRPLVYFGQSQSLNGRFGNYRAGSRGQPTSHRIHGLLKAALASGGRVDVDVATAGVTLEMGGVSVAVDLSHKASRCMVENAAIVVAGGEDIEIANK